MALGRYNITIDDLTKKGFVYERSIGPSQIYARRLPDKTQMILYHPERKEVLVETLHKDTSEETACQEIGYDIYHQDSNSCIDTESYET
jgi:hypothetical protein